MNEQTANPPYFIDASLPGDEGKHFKYILLTENNSINISTGSSHMTGKRMQTESTWIRADSNIAIQNQEELDKDEDEHLLDEPPGDQTHE